MSDWQSPTGSNDRVTYDDKGRLDEIVGSRFAHLEHMNKDSWFLLIGHDDGTETALWFTSHDLRKPLIERREPRAILEGESK